MTAIHADEIKDLIMSLFVCSLFYFFAFYVTRKIDLYFRRKKLENNFANIFTNEFLARFKREEFVSRIRNELEKIPCTKLCSVQSKQNNDKKQNF